MIGERWVEDEGNGHNIVAKNVRATQPGPILAPPFRQWDLGPATQPFCTSVPLPVKSLPQGEVVKTLALSSLNKTQPEI